MRKTLNIPLELFAQLLALKAEKYPMVSFSAMVADLLRKAIADE